MTTTAPYPMPDNNDTQGFLELFTYINNVTDGLFFPMILFIIWIVTFIASKIFSNSRAFTVASFITSFLSMMLAVLGLAAPKYAYLSIILLAAGILWIKLDK